TRFSRDWSSDVCSSDLGVYMGGPYWQYNEGQAIVLTADTVITHGVSSAAVAIRSGGDLTIDLGQVVAEGDRSPGVAIASGWGDKIGRGSCRVSGQSGGC